MSRIFWDTNVFIYLLEGSGKLMVEAKALRNKMLVRGDELMTSTITLGEVLVKPIERGDAKAVSFYENLLKTTARLLPFEEKAAIVYARLRLDRSLRPPDAIQLACAATVGVDLFITNDTRLHTKHVPGIQFIVPLDRVPF
ncbi:MAG TPA: PIN domain-containing protein [Candidatus Acidoferrum sp.]|nr:PIN domain-containing protein [Candidatus Acidoferrum sp.]